MVVEAEEDPENGETPEWGTRQSNRKAASVCDYVCEYGATANGCRLNWQHFIKKYKKH